MVIKNKTKQTSRKSHKQFEQEKKLYVVAPGKIEAKSIVSEQFREIYNFYRL